MKYKKITILALIILINVLLVYATSLYPEDEFTADSSTDEDAKTFVNRDMDMEIGASGIMVACWDYDNPSCDENPTTDDCYAASVEDFADCAEYYPEIEDYTYDPTPGSRDLDVSNDITSCVDAVYYKNCDTDPSKYTVTQQRYYVYDAKRYHCNDTDSSLYDAQGRISSSGYTYTAGISCGAGKICSNALDDSWVYTYDGTIPDPCIEADETDIEIIEIIPIQVIPNVTMIKEKSGYVRVVVRNNGPLHATVVVNASFDGQQLERYSPIGSQYVFNQSNVTFDFYFKPNSTGSGKIIAANVAIVG